MSKLRSVNTHFWNDAFIIDLDPVDKLVFLYLLTNEQTNMLGIYELHIKKISFETGIEISLLEKVFQRFEKAKKAKYLDAYVILPNFIKHQNYNPNMQVSAIQKWNELPESVQNDSLSEPILKGLKAFNNKNIEIKNPSKTLTQGLPNPLPRVTKGLYKGSEGQTDSKKEKPHLEAINGDSKTLTKGLPNPYQRVTKGLPKGSEPMGEYEIELEYETESESERETETRARKGVSLSDSDSSKKSLFYDDLVSLFQGMSVPTELDSIKFRRKIFDFNLMWSERDKRLPAIQTIEQQYRKLLDLKAQGNDPVSVIEYALEGGNRRFFPPPEQYDSKPLTPGEHREDFLTWLNSQRSDNAQPKQLYE